MTTSDLIGVTAVVTGASRGFGRSIAIRLARAGADVVGVARDRAALLDLHEHLGASFTPVAGNVTDPDLAAQLISRHRPQVLVLNAGATPIAARVQDQSWASFSDNWNTDVRQSFEFTRAALGLPLDAGSLVINMSSGAALAGSPLSGGYAGAKAMVRFISSYAAAESGRLGLGIRFVSVLPKLTPATALGAAFVDGYAAYSGTDRATYLTQLGATLTADQVGLAVTEIATDASKTAASYMLTAAGLQELS
ncbi:MAG: SDR family oxidoreductase [Acidimicrobiales bacterium]